MKQIRSIEPLAPIVFVVIKTKNTKDGRPRWLKALLDSGASSSIAQHEVLQKLKLKEKPGTVWTSAVGKFETTMPTKTHFLFPEFLETRIIISKLHATKKTLAGYNMIIGRDLLKELGIILNFKSETILWGDGEIPMKPRYATVETSFFINKPEGLAEEADRMSKILDAKYSKADIKKIAAETKGLMTEQSQKLEEILRQNESLIDGKQI